MRLVVPRPRPSTWTAIHWVFLGLAVVTAVLLLGAAVLLSSAATALDSDRELKDFESPAQARDFVSAHLPTPLPSTAVVEALRYQRWTDWHLQAEVRLKSAEGVASYLEQARQKRASNEAYCGGSGLSGGVSFFLSDVSACGSVTATSPVSLHVVCATR
jgi:hypothetical protein